MQDVWFAPVGADDPNECADAMGRLLHTVGVPRGFKKGDLVGIKVHVSETGRRNFLGCELAAVAVRVVSATGASPFFTDTCVLYRSRRDDAVNHTRVAHEHGYSLERAGAPFLVADGLVGTDEEMVRVGGLAAPVAVASLARRAHGFVVLAHATGHLATGYGGVIKAIGMGLASRKGKLTMHAAAKPFVGRSCTACGECAAWCPVGAITVKHHAIIDRRLCIGCGECVAVCRFGAVGFDWDATAEELQRRIAEHAAAVLDGRLDRFFHVCIALRVTKDCDCMPDPGPPLFPDIGILSSRDPVAVDQAVLDLIEERTGAPLGKWAYEEIDPTIQLARAEELGLGSRAYRLVTI